MDMKVSGDLNRDEHFVWGLNTANDFRAVLRFPRVAREPPRRMRSCGVSHWPLLPQESSSCTPINRWNKLNHITSYPKLKPELICLL